MSPIDEQIANKMPENKLQEWFQPNPSCPDGGYLISMRGTLMLLLKEAFEEDNEKAKGYVEVIFEKLKRRGYTGERLVKRAFKSKRQNTMTQAKHVDTMFNFMTDKEFGDLVSRLFSS